MTKVPQAPTEIIAAEVHRMLQDYQDQRPVLLLMYEHVALVKRDRYTAFINVGFTDSQAFELFQDK